MKKLLTKFGTRKVFKSLKRKGRILKKLLKKKWRKKNFRKLLRKKYRTGKYRKLLRKKFFRKRWLRPKYRKKRAMKKLLTKLGTRKVFKSLNIFKYIRRKGRISKNFLKPEWRSQLTFKKLLRKKYQTNEYQALLNKPYFKINWLKKGYTMRFRMKKLLTKFGFKMVTMKVLKTKALKKKLNDCRPDSRRTEANSILGG